MSETWAWALWLSGGVVGALPPDQEPQLEAHQGWENDFLPRLSEHELTDPSPQVWAGFYGSLRLEAQRGDWTLSGLAEFPWSVWRLGVAGLDWWEPVTVDSLDLIPGGPAPGVSLGRQLGSAVQLRLSGGAMPWSLLRNRYRGEVDALGGVNNPLQSSLQTDAGWGSWAELSIDKHRAPSAQRGVTLGDGVQLAVRGSFLAERQILELRLGWMLGPVWSSGSDELSESGSDAGESTEPQSRISSTGQ